MSQYVSIVNVHSWALIIFNIDYNRYIIDISIESLTHGLNQTPHLPGSGPWQSHPRSIPLLLEGLDENLLHLTHVTWDEIERGIRW
jgi:hypothetical protein